MRTFTAEQQAVLDCTFKTEVSWLYQIDATGNGTVDYYWSTKDKTWSGQDYTFRVIKQDDIEMNRNQSETGRMSPCSFSFTATNPNSTLRVEDFTGGTVTILLVIKANTTVYGEIEQEIARWSFDIEQAVINKVQSIQFKCQDFLKKYLQGSYPKYPTVSSVLPSTGNSETSFCIPKVFGTPYIPLGTVATNAQLWYVCGPDDSYTFYKARTPHDWPTNQLSYEWTATTSGGDTTFSSEATTGVDGNNYRLLTVVAMDTTGDQVADSNIALRNGDSYYTIPIQFGRDAALATTNPIDIMYFIMRDYDIPVSHIDDTTRVASAASCTTWGLSMNFGLWYYKDREELLASLAVQSNVELVLRDKIYFKPHTSASVATIDKSCVVRTISKMGQTVDIKGPAKFSYTPNTLVPSMSDSGYALYQRINFPIDSLNTYLTPCKNDAEHVSDTKIDCMWIGDAEGMNAYKITKMHLQRILLPIGKVEMTCMPQMLKLECDDTVTVTPQDYGAGTGNEYKVLIDSIRISKELEIIVSATKFSDDLDDFVAITNPVGQTPYTGTAISSFSPVTQGTDQSGSSLNSVSQYVWVGSSILISGVDQKISIHGHPFETEGVQFGMDSNYPKFYIGDGSSRYFRFRYNSGYMLSWASDYTRLNENGSFYCTQATIGGWHASTSTLSGRNLILDSAGSIHSRNYMADHAGFKIFDDGSAEFLDLTARGSFHASVFVADEIMAISNTAILSNSSTLSTVCTSSATLDGHFIITVNDPPVGAYSIFSANDFVVIKTLIGTNIEEVWGQVVDYDSGGFTNGYRNNANGTGSYFIELKHGTTGLSIPSGVAVVRYGASTEDNLMLTSDNTNGPYVEIFSVGSAPWTSITPKARFGNLTGIVDGSFATAPSGYGLYADNVYLKGHIVISGGTGVQNFDDWQEAIGAATDGTVDWIEVNGVPEDIFYKNSDDIGDITWLSTYLSGQEVISPIIAGNAGFFSQVFRVGHGTTGIAIDGTSSTSGYIQSGSFASGSAGWKISNSGDAQFNNIYARGTVQSSTFTTGVSGWKIDKSGDAQFNNIYARGVIHATDGSFTGQITITTGSGIANFSDVGTLATQDTVEWGTQFSEMPARFGESPSADGLYVTDSYLGFYKDSAWRAYLDNNGSFMLADSTGATGLVYFGTNIGTRSTGDLIVGSMASNYLLWDQSQGDFILKTAGSLNLKKGADLSMEGDDSDPALINFKCDATRGYHFGAGVSSPYYLALYPYTEDVGTLLLGEDVGGTSKRFYRIRAKSGYVTQIDTGDDDGALSRIYMTGSPSGAIPAQIALHAVGSLGTATFSIISNTTMLRGQINCDFGPDINNTYDCGSDSLAWQDIYFYTSHDKCSILDSVDDVEIIKSIIQLDTPQKGLITDKFGFPQMDLVEMPHFLTNKDKLAEMITKEIGQQITADDLVDIKNGRKNPIHYSCKNDEGKEEDRILDADMIISRTFRNTGMTLDLALGAIKKLDERIKLLENVIYSNK